MPVELAPPVELKTNERRLRVRIDIGESRAPPFELVTRGDIFRLSGLSECLRRVLMTDFSWRSTFKDDHSFDILSGCKLIYAE